MLYIGIAIAALLLLWFIKSANTLNNISEEATLLVAYIKYSAKGKSMFFDEDKTDAEFIQEKYNRLLTACYLMNKFFIRVKDLPATQRFHIIENGDTFGEIFEVQVGPLIYKLTETLTKITESLPVEYQEKIDAYMRNPFSLENKKIGEEVNERLFPKAKFLKKYADAARESIKNMDFMYFLCKGCKIQ